MYFPSRCARDGQLIHVRKYGPLNTELPDIQPASKLRVDVDQELQHVSLTLNTIEPDSVIVCGLLALPHDLVPHCCKIKDEVVGASASLTLFGAERPTECNRCDRST